MLGHREMSIDDYLEILRKRWWLILLPAILGSAGVYLFSLTLADQYTSRTLVLVEQQKVPDSYVKSVFTDDITERLGTMQEQILSRTRLEPIMDKFDLYKNQKGKASKEDLVDQLRHSISVTPLRSLISTRDGEMPGFSINFTGNDPKLTQQVCQEILSMFISENLKLLTGRAEDTTEFMKKALDDAKEKLDAQDARLADFKRKYMGSLPGDQQVDLSMMTALSTQLDAVTNQLMRAQQDKSYIDSMLAQQLAAWQQAQKNSISSGGTGVENSQDPLQRQLTDLQSQLVAMKSHYTDDHPDVVKLKADIAALKEKIKENAPPKDNSPTATEAAKATEPPAIQQLRFQSHQAEVLIREKTREQTQLRGQLSQAQGRLSMSPTVEQQYKEITRDYQTALTFYNDLLAKKNQSELSTNLQRQQQGEQLRVLDPPNLPERPSYPNRPLFAGAGLGAGLALGLGITFLLELRDKTMRTENDIEHFLGLPTLAMVPVVTPAQLKGKKTPGGDRARLPEAAHV